jgi:hypothetical protein
MPETSFSAPDDLEDERTGERKTSLIQLDVTMDEQDEGLSFGLDKEFDRLAEARKVDLSSFLSASLVDSQEIDLMPDCNPLSSFKLDRYANVSVRKQNGYLMRQNTKVVVASSASNDSTEAGARGTKSAGNSPIKRNNSNAWTTEPWVGKTRRRSIRQSAGSPMKRPTAGPAPPLPGMVSNVNTELGTLADETMAELEEFDESGERGRLFVKVVGVKDLDLQLPRGMYCLIRITHHD